jgi:hypothetical protein
MNRFRPRRPSPALAVALLALFVALGGTGYAAFKLPKNSVGTKQIKTNAVTGAKVKNGSLTGADINAGTLGTIPAATHASSADSAIHANGADQAPPVGGAGGALSGSFPNPSLACPSGTNRLGDSCVETSNRADADWQTAINACTGAGRRLGTPAEVWALAERDSVGGWTSTAYQDNNGTTASNKITAIFLSNGVGGPAPFISFLDQMQTHSYRCFANLGSQ